MDDSAVTSGQTSPTPSCRSGPATGRRPAGPVADLDGLYRAEYEPMVRLARLLTGSQAIAEEVVQDAFVTLHQRAIDPSSTPLDRPGAYLRRIVVNNSYGHLRRRGTEDRKLSQVAAADDPILPPELDETWRALARLSPKHRTALVLRYYEDLSVRTVAELMDVREGTVKSLVHRGLRHLEKELDR